MNGKELFYRTPDNKIAAVTYTAASDSFHAGKPQPWSPGRFRDHWLGFFMYNFDAHPDGKRFCRAQGARDRTEPRCNKVAIVLNWFAELTQKVRQ
jgi:hypothetical protein